MVEMTKMAAGFISKCKNGKKNIFLLSLRHLTSFLSLLQYLPYHGVKFGGNLITSTFRIPSHFLC